MDKRKPGRPSKPHEGITISVRDFPPDLWHEFKVACLKKREALKDTLAEIVREYVQTAREGGKE